MTILGWYSVVLLSLMVVTNVANEKDSGGARLASVLLTLPMLIFALLYVI